MKKVVVAVIALIAGAAATWILSRSSSSAHASMQATPDMEPGSDPAKPAVPSGAVLRRISQIVASRAEGPVKDAPPPVKPEGWEEIPNIVSLGAQHDGLYDAYQLALAKARVGGGSQRVRACAEKLPKDASVEWESASVFEPDGRGSVMLKRQRVLPLDELDRDPTHAPFFDCVRRIEPEMTIPLPAGMTGGFELRESHTAVAPSPWPLQAEELRDLSAELRDLREQLSPESEREHPLKPAVRLLVQARVTRLGCIVEEKRNPSECP